MTRAQGTFTVKSWDEDTYRELDEDSKLTRAQVIFGLTGDLEAEGSWNALMCYRNDGTAVYTGLQHTVGKVAGRSGSFVLRADGAYENGAAETSWEVIPGSATGELRGLTGTGSAVTTGGSGGTFSLDLDLG
jgi:Protein of unknown function (DUF3224)